MTVVAGVGVIIVNEQGEILLGKRCGKHAPFWSIPGGHLDAGETFEQCAQREIAEETGLIIAPPSFVGISNNLQTWRAEGKHTVSICLLTPHPGGEAELKDRKNVPNGAGACRKHYLNRILKPAVMPFICG